jgi:hypothetical protein
VLSSSSSSSSFFGSRPVVPSAHTSLGSLGAGIPAASSHVPVVASRSSGPSRTGASSSVDASLFEGIPAGRSSSTSAAPSRVVPPRDPIGPHGPPD